jgi:hypothetical protein
MTDYHKCYSAFWASRQRGRVRKTTHGSNKSPFHTYFEPLRTIFVWGGVHQQRRVNTDFRKTFDIHNTAVRCAVPSAVVRSQIVIFFERTYDCH